MKKVKEIIVVVGPTASGKSNFAVDLALKHNGEIISADSRQIYKGLDIGTGKITKKEMKGVRHYMLDVANVKKGFSVEEYQKLALPILEDIISRGKTPIICGGTGQYIDSLIFKSEFPKVPPNKKLREKLEKLSNEELYKKLLKLDKRRAKTIDRHNKVRLIRALEIIESLGKVPKQGKVTLRHPTKIFLLNPDRTILRKKIETRLLARLDTGMIKESKKLIKNGVSHKTLDRLGLEYRYISRYILGKITYEKMVEELKNKISQYAKRQQTWNKKYLRKETASSKLDITIIK